MPIANAYTLIINIVSILFLLGLSMLLLLTNKHMKTGVGFAIIAITTTIPIYIYNIFFSQRWFIAAIWIAPLAYTVGTAFFPSLWLYIHRYFNPHTKFDKIRLVHFIPTIACFLIYVIYIALLTFPERINFLLYQSTYMSRWIGAINIAVVSAQAVTYSVLIFVYLTQVRRFIGKTFTETNWSLNLWIPKTLIILIVSFTALLICHHIFRKYNTWMLNILDMAVMACITYNVLKVPHDKKSSRINPIAGIEIDQNLDIEDDIDAQKINDYATLISDYLKTSKTYLNPTLTIKDVSDSLGISAGEIAQALAARYKCNFLEFVNKMRIDRAVRVLNNDTAQEQNLESITYQSGFLSPESFAIAFKKNIGKTPSQFIYEVRKK